MNKQFSERNRRRCEATDGFNHKLNSWSGSDWMVAVLGELGEAANVLKKLNRVRDGVPGNKEPPEQLRRKFANELADAYVYLDLLCQAHEIDLEAAVYRVFEAKSEQIGYIEPVTETETPSTQQQLLTAERQQRADAAEAQIKDLQEACVLLSQESQKWAVRAGEAEAREKALIEALRSIDEAWQGRVTHGYGQAAFLAVDLRFDQIRTASERYRAALAQSTPPVCTPSAPVNAGQAEQSAGGSQSLIIAFLADPDTLIHRLRSGKHQVMHPSIQSHVGQLGEMVQRAAQEWSKANEPT